MGSRTYVNTTLEDFKKVFPADRGWNLDSVGYEHSFWHRMPRFPHIVIRVLTGVSVTTNTGRAVGGDCIRIYAVRTEKTDALEPARGWISAKRVFRVEGWQGRIIAKVTDTIREAIQRETKRG